MRPVLQAPPSRHLGLGNLLPGVARSAIELAFGQYGVLEAASVAPLRPVPGGGGGGMEAHLTFREAAAAAAAQRGLNGAFHPSLTGGALPGKGTTAAPSIAVNDCYPRRLMHHPLPTSWWQERSAGCADLNGPLYTCKPLVFLFQIPLDTRLRHLRLQSIFSAPEAGQAAAAPVVRTGRWPAAPPPV